MKIKITLIAEREFEIFLKENEGVGEERTENDIMDEYQQATIDDPFLFIDDARIKLSVTVKRLPE